VSISTANDFASLPVAYRLYLPHEWNDDPSVRCRQVYPVISSFRRSRRSHLDQLRAVHAAGIEAEMGLADAGYGTDTDFRDGITEIGLPYTVGIKSSTTLRLPGIEPLPPKQWSGRGRPTFFD
jgi:SRSO17 transposase